MIAVGDKRAIAVRGDYRPVEINVGGRKVAGWTEQAVEGVTQAEIADTYNDRAQVTVQGARLEQDAEPTPESPQPIHGTEAVVTVSNADTEAVETALPVLYGRDGVCDVLETDVVVDGVHRSRVTRWWHTVVMTGGESLVLHTPDDSQKQDGFTVLTWRLSSIAVSADAEQILVCTHYPAKNYGYANPTSGLCIAITSGRNQLMVKQSAAASTKEFSAYLAAQYAAGTPVTIVYQLAAPIVELGDPIDVRTLPRSTIIGCTDPFSAVVKTVDRTI